MDLTALKTEILTGPIAAALAPFLTGGSQHETGANGLSWCDAIASILNEPRNDTTARRQPIARRDIKETILARGKLTGILTSENATAKAIQILFSDPDFQTINTDSPVWSALMAGLVGTGEVDASDTAAISALADVSPASRVQAIGGWDTIPVTGSDVVAAMGGS